MKYLLIILFLLGLGFSTRCNAQRYKSAAGVRMDGKMFGLTYSQRFLKRSTGELNVDFREKELKSSIVGKFHKRLIGKGLTSFVGLGYHIGNHKDVGSFSGPDFTVGLEHKILVFPISIGFEINPSIHIGGEHPDYFTFQSSFSVKYVLVKHRKGLFKK